MNYHRMMEQEGKAVAETPAQSLRKAVARPGRYRDVGT